MTEGEQKKSALLVLGGTLENRRILSHLAAKTQTIVAADGGARHLFRYGLTPHVLIGDLDSTSSERLIDLEKKQVRIIHEHEQESTDFEKALRWLKREGYSTVFVVGIGGGGSDHVLTNMSVLLRYAYEFQVIEAYDDSSKLSILLPESTLYIDRGIGTRVSLIPLTSAVGISTSGLEYMLHDEELAFGVRDGLGNRIIHEAGASISIRDGALLVSVELEEHLR